MRTTQALRASLPSCTDAVPERCIVITRTTALEREPAQRDCKASAFDTQHNVARPEIAGELAPEEQTSEPIATLSAQVRSRRPTRLPVTNRKKAKPAEALWEELVMELVRVGVPVRKWWTPRDKTCM